MTLAVPVIYSRVAPPARLGPLGRLAALAVAGGALAVLVVAAVLTPSHAGFGTHRELGLQPCAFRDRTGLPCPSCGFTTSFSYFARGNLPAAFYTQPMGLVLAILTAAAVWVAGYTAWSGRPIYRLLRLVPSRYSMMPLLIGALLGWGWKVFLTLRGLDGWSG